MRWYPWLRPHFKHLLAGYQEGRGHHALLIQSLPGMGDNALIYAITRFLMCPLRFKKDKSCGKCRSCHLMEAETHPDYYTFGLEKGRSTLGIDAVREVSEKLYKHARLGGAKVVWLTDTSLLTEAAVNALLKILEEPPDKTWFFLSYRESGRLPATLRSRCCRYQLTVPKEEWALGWLQQEVTASQDAMLAALRLCCGAPAAALELLQENYWTQRSQLCLALGNVLKSCDWLSLLTVLNHEQAPTRLLWLITLFLDALKGQRGVTSITNVDVRPLVNNLAGVLTSATLHVIIQVLCQCREQLLTVNGLNRELILTDRLLVIEYFLQSSTTLPIFHL